MDLKRIYNNPKMEAKKQALLKQQEASLLLVSTKKRYFHKSDRIADALNEARERKAQVEKNIRPPWRTMDKLTELFTGLAETDQNYLYRILKVVEKETDFFEDETYCWKFINGCKAMAYWGDLWVRQPEDWVNKTHNVERQFSGLLHHLFAKYKVPSFMNEAFLSNEGIGNNKQDWFIHIGSGKNIRTADGLPFPMTKMMAHLFLEAPADFKIMEAFRLCQIRSLGGSMAIARGWLESPLAVDFRNMEFWNSVIRFFIDNPMLDPDKIAPIIDYINHQRYVDVIEITPEGERNIRGPAQPNFTMKGRNIETLLNQVEAWHTHTARSKKNPFLQWKSCGIAGGRFEEGAGAGKKIYSMIELLNSNELKEEGKAMAHCVATYAGSCSAGRNAVYSLTQVEGKDCGRKATISVSLSGSKCISEARGRFNAPLSAPVARIIRTWANVRGVSISSWAKI